MSKRSKLEKMLEDVAYMQEELEQLMYFLDVYESTPHTKEVLRNCLVLKPMVSEWSTLIGAYKAEYRGLLRDQIGEGNTLLDNKISRKVRMVSDTLGLLDTLVDNPDMIANL